MGCGVGCGGGLWGWVVGAGCEAVLGWVVEMSCGGRLWGWVVGVGCGDGLWG